MSTALHANRVAAALLWMTCLSHSQPAKTVFDLSADFSLQKNPNRAWQYGYSAAQSLDSTDFRLDESKDEMVAIAFWHPASNQGPGPGYYPYVAYNHSKKTEYGSSNGWAARSGQTAMEASNTGQYSIVRFVVPGNGTYKISARFEGIHFGLSTTDVHVTHNGRSRFAADVTGYGGDPALHKIEGESPTASYSMERTTPISGIRPGCLWRSNC